MEWSRVAGHAGYEDRYAGSGVSGGLFFLAYTTNYSHQAVAPSGTVSDLEFVIMRAEGGEGIINDCKFVLSSDSGPVTVLSVIMAQENGIYLLLKVPAGTLTSLHDSAQYRFSSPSFVIAVLELDSSGVSPEVNLIGITAYPTSTSVLVYPPVRMLLYYPSGKDGYGVPEILLLAHVSHMVGLVVYGFANVTCAAISPASHNPLVTDTGCTATNCDRCFSDNPSKCAQCVSAYSLLSEFTCSSGCPSGYYSSPEGTRCRRCHYTCATCSGPGSTDCLTCDAASREFAMGTGQCLCSTTTMVTNGDCTTSCPVGYSGYAYEGLCKDRCPGYRFHSVDYGASTAPTTTNFITGSEGADLLEFDPASASCLQLPGPAGATAISSKFTVSFWFYATSAWSSAQKVVLWGFNSFMLRAAGNNAEFVMLSSDGIEISTGVSAAAMSVNAWYFVAASVRLTSAGYDAKLYMGASGSSLTLEGQKTATFTFQPYTNALLVGCLGTRDAFSGSLATTSQVGIGGYMRELVYQAQFYSLASMQGKANFLYAECLEVYKTVLSYWRFDELSVSGTNIVLQDSSRYQQTATIPATGSPKKASTTAPGTPGCTQIQEDLGKCVDLFEGTEFPHVSLDINNFASDYLEPRINTRNGDGVLGTIVGDGDTVQFHSRGCDGTLLQEARVTLSADGTAISIEKDRYLPQTVYGTHVDICYHSAIQQISVKMGQVYFPEIPLRISPSHGSNYVETATAIAFDLAGGDQAEGDVLSFYSIERGLAVAMQDTIQLSESDLPSKTVRDSSGDYAEVSTEGMDAATYTVLWRPYYAKYVAANNLFGYKNMFTLWMIEETPRLRFQLMAGMKDLYQTAVNFKAEFYYPDLVGPAQTDGDQIMFCYVGCQYSNHKGEIYTRVNGVYPPVWLGEAYGVHNLATNLLYNRLYVCWRPAAETTTTLPASGNWRAVNELSTAGGNAYLRANLLSDNKDLPEIAAMNPPLSDALLREGDYVWFQISKCDTYKMKPSASDSGVPGRVQVVHVIYNAEDHSAYTTEVVWEQTFPVLSDSTSEGFTVGKLHGDYSTCNYTLNDLPWQSMLPGHKYILIIYSKSFRSAVTNTYLFGNIDPGKAVLKFWFTYQEAQFRPTYQQIVPTSHELSISIRNFGDVAIPGSGFTETHRLFTVLVNLTSTSDCSLPSGYIVRSWLRDNPTELRLRGIDLKSCAPGVLTIGITIIKLSSYTGDAFWSYSSTKTDLWLGNVTCDPSCLSCDGIGPEDCISCNKSGSTPYLSGRQCVSECPTDLPYPEPAFSAGTSTVEAYTCVANCAPGMYLDRGLGMCMRCYEGCGNCTSAQPMSCTSCLGSAIGVTGATEDYNNTYNESYLFRGMCMSSCPTVTNDFLPSRPNLVSADEYAKTCVISTLPGGSHPIYVSLQPETVNIKQTLILKAITTDPTGNLTATVWGTHPAEDETAAGFYSSESRVFSSYLNVTEDTLNKEINVNAFNYKGVGNEMRIIVKVMTCDSLAFAIVELFSDSPPTLEAANVAISPAAGLATLGRINISVSGTEDSDDYYPLIRCKVMLVPRIMAIPDGVSSATSSSALMVLAQLPANTLTLYSIRLETSSSGVFTLRDIFIPPLVSGPQALTTDVTSDKVTCDLIVMCEDRQNSSIQAKLTFNITEKYNSTQRSAVIVSLYADVMKAKQTATFSFDLALRVAHTFRVINPVPAVSYVSYTYCSKDTQCKGKGKCTTNGGWSQCECFPGYTGVSCEWARAEMDMEFGISSAAMEFLNSTLAAEDNPDSHTPDQLANVLTGVLANPETVGYEWLDVVVRLCLRMTDFGYEVGRKLADYERLNLFTAVDSVMKYVLFQLRKVIYRFYLLGESRTESDSLKAEYTAQRADIAGVILSVRDSLYALADSVSHGLHPGEDAYRRSFDTFSILVVAITEASLFNDLGDELAVTLLGSDGQIKLPADIIQNVRARVEKNEEFKVRAVAWSQSPYLFSDLHSEVCSTVYNLAILDSLGRELVLNLSTPIVYFLPLANLTRDSRDEFVKCKYFNRSFVQNQTVTETTFVDVNALNASNWEKKAQYPEWDAELYSGSHLIANSSRFVVAAMEYPEFVDVAGVSSYGNIQKPGQYQSYVPCAAYHGGDVAAVMQRKRSARRTVVTHGFYYYYDSWDAWLGCLGFYVAISLSSLFVVMAVMVKFADQLMLPRLEKIIELHRMESSDKDEDAMVSVAEEKLKFEGETAFGSLEKHHSCGSSTNNNKVAEEKSAVGSNPEVSSAKDGSGSADEGNCGRNNDSAPERTHEPNASEGSASRQDGPGSGQLNVEHQHHHPGRQSTIMASAADSQSVDSKKQGEQTTSGMNQSTTQEMTTLAMMNTTKVTGGGGEEDPKLFANVGADEIRRRAARGERKIEDDIFSEQHVAQREAEDFTIRNVYVSGNSLLSMIMRTNVLFTRTARCFLFFNQLFILLGLCALGIEMQAGKIDHSEDTKPVSKLVRRDAWVILLMPLVSAFVGYFYAALFKLRSSYALGSRTMAKYRRC